MRGGKLCPSCGTLLGNAAKRCRYCGNGTASDHMAGYKRVWVPGHPMAAADGYALEHRWLMYEMAIPVPDGYHVHHRNGVRNDNRWSNLEIIEGSEHVSRHIREAGTITNQHGTFPVLYDEDARRERLRRHNAKRLGAKREWQRRKRDGGVRPC